MARAAVWIRRCRSPVAPCASPASPASGRPAGAGIRPFRVVFNPSPRDLGIAPRSLASAYRADVPTATVLSRSRRRPTRRGRFRVPVRAPPGVYLVLIFDGSEGGAHNSWEYLHVLDAVERAQSGVVTPRRGSLGAVATDRADTRRGGGPLELAWW